MNKNIKKIISLMLTIAMIASMSSMVFALPDSLTQIEDPTSNTFTSATNRVLGYVRFFGYAMAIGMLIYLGIKYMMSSANEKADLKKGSINYVIGAVVIAASTAIITALIEVSNEVVQ